jgi:hypothetical protein
VGCVPQIGQNPPRFNHYSSCFGHFDVDFMAWRASFFATKLKEPSLTNKGGGTMRTLCYAIAAAAMIAVAAGTGKSEDPTSDIKAQVPVQTASVSISR